MASPEPVTTDSAGRVPGAVEKNRGLGANARLRYAPGGLLGEGGAVYFVTGVQWERATVRRGSDIGGESIRVVADHTLRPWVAGAGVEWGNLANRVGLEVRYSPADLEFRTGGDGSALGMPRIDHRFGTIVRISALQIILPSWDPGTPHAAARSNSRR